ncbi:MAG: NADH-quinone oxidoreductase subunit L [Spirochaetes bacterium]|nr:NADH-quinone oxidoreductase subunit L [Spirochaetota bacterium]
MNIVMDIIILLIAFPLIISLVLAILPARPFWIWRSIGFIVNILLITAVIYLYYIYPDSVLFFHTKGIPHVNLIMLGLGLIIGIVIAVMAFRARRYYIIGLVVVQIAIMVAFEVMYGEEAAATVFGDFFIDKVSLIIALIIGIIGSLICNYALGYIVHYHEHHPEVKNRIKLFLFMFYLFLSAMFGIVFSNNLLWLHLFWEITTFCSFILIGYKGDEESDNSAYRALWMNMLGGIALFAAIFYSYKYMGFIEIDKIVRSGSGVALLPAALICFAGIIKSAQMPFSSWLTGAMVAPTPVSALLHSSTMVKAGVYIIIRFAPALGPAAGLMLALVGGITFLAASFIAVSQNNAKRVLAYSTISVLGLIVMCAGINTPETLRAAMLLIVFHAIAKSLLFLCVGVIEGKLGSRDIENMDYLFMKMPKVTIMLSIGLSGMFLVPFGMLVGKWVTLKALIDYNPIFSIILAFGSAAMMFFYTKWMGKALTIEDGIKTDEKGISVWEWTTLITISILTVGVCLVFPFIITTNIIEPNLLPISGMAPDFDEFSAVVMAVMMLGLIVIVPAGLIYYSKIFRGYKKVGPYLAGANLEPYHYRNSLGVSTHADLKNYYLTEIFDENKLLLFGIFVSLTFIAIMFGVTIL